MQIYIILLTGFLAHVSGVTACTCYPVDPQTKYCGAVNVVIANVTGMTYGEGYPIIDTPRTYDVNVLHVYKGNIGKGPAKIVTAENDAICGVTLLKKKVYLLNGNIENGKMRIRQCSIISYYPIKDPNTFPLDAYYDCRCKVKRMLSGEVEKNTCDVVKRARRCPSGSRAFDDRPECQYNKDKGDCEWKC
ncbi:metalloproteinase inhibitor 2-like [Ostrea edulis]|uniref:metalloproteinase inhibitor 2-like n=1 Tax=Ostrea edulis TaxID=37623 RepID=UPI0024AF8312|nr:metalloproteinase inhibitor 2-like [Ostrea edulis]